MSQYCDETADVCHRETRRARKPHQCDACDREIKPGELYCRDAILYDGEWSAVTRCACCELIYQHLSQRIRKGGDWDEFCDPELNCGHDYEERWGEEPPPEIAALAFMTPEEAQERLREGSGS